MRRAGFIILSVVFFSCGAEPIPPELKGTWISSYTIGHYNNDMRDAEFQSNSSWEIFKIDSLQLTVCEFKNRMNYLEGSERAYDYWYENNQLIYTTETGNDTIIIASFNKDSMVILLDPDGLYKRVFRKINPQPSVFPPIAQRAYEIVAGDFRDTLVIIEDGKLVRLCEGQRNDGRRQYWYTQQVDSCWFFNIEDQFGEPVLVQSVKADTIYLKAFAFKEQSAFMVPIPTSDLKTKLQGNWKQQGTVNEFAFLPFLQLNGPFHAEDSVARIKISERELVIHYGGQTGTWPFENRWVHNTLLINANQEDADFGIWRFKMINEDRLEVSIYSLEDISVHVDETILFMRE